MDKIELLQKSALFEMLSPAEVELAAELSRPKRFKAGEAIFKEGELGDALFVIASGDVEIVGRTATGQAAVLSVLRPGEFFGEMSLIDKEVRSATARAKDDCVLLQLTAENFAAFRKHHRDGFVFVVMNIARVLSSRLRDVNARLAAKM